MEMENDVNLLGRYEEKIAKRPWVAIAIIVAITLSMGYFAMRVSMNTTEDSFRPDSNVANAQTKVKNNYGTQKQQISIIFSADSNILKKETLLKQLKLEDEIKSSEYYKFIEGSQRKPSGISSPAKIIAQGLFLNTAFRKIIQENQGLDIETVIGRLTSNIFSLTTENMKTILNGGTLHLSLPEIGVYTELQFQPYEPKLISNYMKNLPFENGLAFLLSTDYDRETQIAKKSLLSITIQENLAEDKTLEIERAFQEFTREIEDKDTLKVSLVGTALINKGISEASSRNIGLLMPIAFIVVIVILFIVYSI